MSRQLLFSKYSVNFFKMGLGYVFKDPVMFFASKAEMCDRF